MQQEEKQNRKKQTGPSKRNKGEKETNRNCYRKSMKTKKEIKRR
jgi:hypothetical protein